MYLSICVIKKFILMFKIMFSKFYSPHILVYKPQTNSVFSLFLRFILLAVFTNFLLSIFYIKFLSFFIFSYFLEILFISELLIIFYVISYLSEDLIDYDSTGINFLDIDLVVFFKFFLNLSLVFLFFLSFFIIFKFIFWTTLIVV